MKTWASYVRLVAESSGFCWMVLKFMGASKKLAKAEKAGDKNAAAVAVSEQAISTAFRSPGACLIDCF